MLYILHSDGIDNVIVFLVKILTINSCDPCPWTSCLYPHGLCFSNFASWQKRLGFKRFLRKVVAVRYSPCSPSLLKYAVFYILGLSLVVLASPLPKRTNLYYYVNSAHYLCICYDARITISTEGFTLNVLLSHSPYRKMVPSTTEWSPHSAEFRWSNTIYIFSCWVRSSTARNEGVILIGAAKKPQ